MNLYYAGGDTSIYQCGPRPADADAALDEWFGRIRNETDSNVVRFWAFQSYTTGATDWRGIDRVIAIGSSCRLDWQFHFEQRVVVPESASRS